MSRNARRWERPVVSIEELVAAARRESAAALSTADAFLGDARRKQGLDVPHRFPGPARPLDDAELGPRDAAGPAASGRPT